MRVIGAFAVVLLHVASYGARRFGSVPDVDWWLSNAVCAACRWVVPVFAIAANAPLCRDGAFARSRLVTRWLAPATLGIYLIHPAFKGLGEHLGLTGLWPNVWVGLPATALVLFAASFAATVVLQRLPYLRGLVGQ